MKLPHRLQLSRICVALAGAALLTGCAWRATDKCYLPMSKYRPMRSVFVETGSMQRVEQLMADEEWLDCEKRQMRYLLAKDLHLEDLAEEVPTAAANDR